MPCSLEASDLIYDVLNLLDPHALQCSGEGTYSIADLFSKIFIYLAVLSLSCSMWDLSTCGAQAWLLQGMWDLISLTRD